MNFSADFELFETMDPCTWPSQKGWCATFTASAEEQLLGYAWPGNVRELADTMERSVALVKTSRVDVADIPLAVRLVLPLISDKGVPGL